MLLKDKAQYASLDGFTPGPKYGHLSEKHKVYAAAEPILKEGFSKMFECSTWAEVREMIGDPDAPMPPDGPDRSSIVTELINFNARDGTEIELKVYKSPNVNPNAILMYRIHGGGSVVGRHEVDGAENVYAATNPDIVVVSVDYRKAPEFPAPQALYDGFDGLQWCKANADKLGINPEKIILSGSSAGAHITAGLTLEVRDKGLTGVIAQVLHFPMACHPNLFPKDKYEFGSYIQNADDALLSAQFLEAMMDANMSSTVVNPLTSPLLAESHKGLPPAFIQCGGVDVLRDDAFAYADALREGGVDVEFHCDKGLPHCYPSVLLEIDETAEFYKRYMAFLQKCVDSSK